MLARVAVYLADGTRRVWVIYPSSQTIAVYRPSAEVQLLSTGDTLDGEDVLPGFVCPVADSFAE